MINGQPGYSRTCRQSELTDHRSLARRANSRVPPAGEASEAALESQISERWCWEVGERESEMGSVNNVTRITHYCSWKRTEAAFSESNLNLT